MSRGLRRLLVGTILAGGVSVAVASRGTQQSEDTQSGTTQPGSAQTGSTQTGSTQTGSTQTGSTQTGSTQTGSTQTGSTQFESDAVREALRVPEVRVRELRDRALSEALERQLLTAALASPLETEELRDYYEKFVDRYVKPEAIEVWRILVGSEQRAKELSSRIEKSDTPIKTWSAIAREHSLDKATHFRKGYLGFVRADGFTDVPQVRVSPAIYAAAKRLKDGAYTREPVREGDNWALIWRRSTRPEERTTFESAKPEIIQQLGLARARAQLAELITKLRETHLTEHHPDAVDALPIAPEERNVVPRRPFPSHPADGSPAPRVTDWGDR
jgi:hypothetical protein